MPGVEDLFRSLAVAAIARAHPLTYVDLGGRGGFQADLAPLAFATHAVGFEPDPEAYAELADDRRGAWASVTWIPAAVSAEGGTQTLHIAADPIGSSLLPPNAGIGEKFKKPQFFTIARTVDVETLTMRDVAARPDVGAIDYLKIDIEGPELDIFKSMGPLLDGVLAIKTEVSFLRTRRGGGLASEVDRFLTANGFALMDLIDSQHWRREGTVLHPLLEKSAPIYSRGQLIQGDYLFLREPESLAGDADLLMKLALVAMALGYFDHALMTLEQDAARRRLADVHGAAPLDIVGPASARYGRKMMLRALARQVRGLFPFARALMR